MQKLETDLNIIAGLEDKPTYDSATLKAKFDKGNKIIQEYLNSEVYDAVNKISITPVNNLIEGGTDKALSAEMGKTLNTTKQNVIRYGTVVPTLAVGEIFIQIFN